MLARNQVRRPRSYATAHFFGTDGSAALAGSPIASHRPLATQAQRTRKKGVPVPRWLVAAVLLVLGVILVSMFGRVQREQASIEREMQRQRYVISQAMQRMDEVEAKLDEAREEAHIRSIAMNRMGMHLPTAEQVYEIPTPLINQPKEDGEPNTDSIGVLDIFRGAMRK